MANKAIIYTNKEHVQNKLNKLYIPEDIITKNIKTVLLEIKKSNNQIPKSYENGLFLLEEKKEDVIKPKEVLMSKLKLGEYETIGSNSDKTLAKRIDFIANNLEFFKKFKNVDNLDYIVNNHRQLMYELLEYRKSQALSTFKSDFTAILRIFRLSYATKEHPLYEKYAIIQREIGDILEDKTEYNVLTEREKGQYLDWKIIMRERYNLEEEFKNISNKYTAKAYGLNQNLLLLSMYTLTPTLRNEASQVKFTEEVPKINGDWVYLNKNGNISLELHNLKKTHTFISIPLNFRLESEPSKLSMELLKDQTKLSVLLKESYDLYKREYVFTNINGFPKSSKPMKTAGSRFISMFSKYNVKMGIIAIKKSFVSYRFAKYQHTVVEKKELAFLMRTSVKYLDRNYNKIDDNRYRREKIEAEEIKEEAKEEAKEEVKEEKKLNVFEKNNIRAKKYYEDLKKIPATYLTANGELKISTEANKKNIDRWRAKYGVNMNEEDKNNYRKIRYIREYAKYSDEDKNKIKESTLNKYDLSKFNDDGTLKNKLD